MRMMKLACINFKSSFRSYLSLVISLAFTILVFFNFQNIIYSGSFAVLGEHNKEYVDILIRIVSFVLGCFMFFFIWYSTNVFLTRRKKDIGIYIFMGLSNDRIGKMYMIEITLIGVSALFLGMVAGVITAGLFQMILLALSEIAIDISFRFTMEPVLITAGVYLVIYLIFVIKGYVNIVRSSVLGMISAAKQNEYVRQNVVLLMVRTVLGVAVLGAGYYCAVKESGMEVMANVLAAVVLVTVGVYLLFGGLIPVVFQGLAGNKKFLYRRQRCLWINNVIFRIKKNYRTYAMVCVLILCSVTALATGFAMKYRYDNIIQFDNAYTFQLLSDQPNLDGKARELIEQGSEIAYSSQSPVLFLEDALFEADQYRGGAILSYSNAKGLAQSAGLEFELEEPKEDEVVRASHLYLLSLITNRSGLKIAINGKTYRQTKEVNIPYMGYFQKIMDFYIVNDAEYQKMLPLGQELYAYNYRIGDLNAFETVRNSLDELVSNTEENYTARVASDPNDNDIDWIRVLYSLCIFMFMVFILASGSIMFMRLYNDAFEERERYLVMGKLGFDDRALKKSVRRELGTAYALPFIVMSISSYFSVHALEKMMNTSLWQINVVSVLIVLAIFIFCYGLSVRVYQKNVGIGQGNMSAPA